MRILLFVVRDFEKAKNLQIYENSTTRSKKRCESQEPSDLQESTLRSKRQQKLKKTFRSTRILLFTLRDSVTSKNLQVYKNCTLRSKRQRKLKKPSDLRESTIRSKRQRNRQKPSDLQEFCFSL